MAGTVKTSTLALALRAMGFTATTYDGFLDISYDDGVRSVEEPLEEISISAPNSTRKVLFGEGNFMTEKFHPYLSLDLRREDAIRSRIDLGGLPELARSVIGGNE